MEFQIKCDKREMNPDEMLRFYEEHLKTVLLPFWMDKGIDLEYGGYFTCFDNTGERLLSTDKFTWSQGRMIWIFSELATMNCFPEEERAEFLRLAKSGAEFLMKHCLLPNGACTFLMSRDGTPKPLVADGECDLGTNADIFVVLGLSKFSARSGNREALDFAYKIFKAMIEGTIKRSDKSFPYPPFPGYKSPPMMTLNIAHELALAMDYFGDGRRDEVDGIAEECMNTIMRDFISESYVSHERISDKNRFVSDTLAGRYVNPGHTLEDMWFVIHQALKRDNKEIIEKAVKVIEKTLEIGWDEEYGGLLLFADMDGGKPKGSHKSLENDIMVNKILNDWDNKLWWTHSEALYSTLLAYALTGLNKFIRLYSRVCNYTFATFPNPDKRVGEWIQIRDRFGNPEEKVVALPVKDPFHAIRNVILIMHLLRKISFY